jgi:hypothetical protein
MSNIILNNSIEKKLINIDGKLVLLAKDVAELYEVEVKHLNRMVGKYKHLFPQDYRFQLTADQWKNLKCIKNTSSLNSHGGTRYNPYVYTEKGLYMLATILTKSDKAKQIHMYIIETFANIREISKNIKQIIKTDNPEQQKQLIQKSNDLLHEVIDTQIVEEAPLENKVKKVTDEFQIDLGILKFKRIIENKDL